MIIIHSTPQTNQSMLKLTVPSCIINNIADDVLPHILFSHVVEAGDAFGDLDDDQRCENA